LKAALLAEKGSKSTAAQPSPRWVRVNTLRSSLSELQTSVFEGFSNVTSLAELMGAKPSDRVIYQDPQVPDLIALPPEANLIKSEAYTQGHIILQDKASCFPAQLLLGSVTGKVGDLLDGCAAPGNKTTHMAAITASHGLTKCSRPRRIYACERDAARSKTLRRMVDKAGAHSVNVMDRQDFLALNTEDERFNNVTHLLLDPSCSGSGILRRQDVPKLDLPKEPRGQAPGKRDASTSKKRKWQQTSVERTEDSENDEEQPLPEHVVGTERLKKLADVQTRIVEHAMSFPAAKRITYSTCSIHCEENEMVVARLLKTSVAQRRGWRVLRRYYHPTGLKVWQHRGIQPDSAAIGAVEDLRLTEEELDGCLRCYANDAEGTMGFFVVCFERAHDQEDDSDRLVEEVANGTVVEDEWAGFSDGES
jgi:25S rRNA (cytosine2278-C5)-methyltransferase